MFIQNTFDNFWKEVMISNYICIYNYLLNETFL